ncbi:MAG TPA: YceI family protein [Gemmatimonadales bacterium]|nr:YceI family protein [Gemmatimonadales bacterium]
MSATTTPFATTTAWDIDPTHSGVHFAVKHLMVSTVRGEFGKVAGSVELDAEDITRSRIHAVIDASSINSREAQRDAHLLSPDFLDVERYPTIEFRSTSLARTSDGFDATGELTIRGVTRPVALRVETSGTELTDPFGNLKRGASATAKISRKDFGLEWNVALETGGFLVGDEVKIEIDVELVRRAETL